jgi:aldehyde:ferredoxin oxidoreductase
LGIPIWCDHFGPELKFSGFDLVVILGRAEKPVYLFINGSEVKIRDAGAI